jgi:hypothetical protein
MGRMPPTCFSKANSHDAMNRHDTNGGTWPQVMCHHISNKRSKTLAKSLKTKQFHKSSYTIPKGPSDERRGERIRVEKMPFYSKQDLFLNENHWPKGGRSTSTNGWKLQRVLADGSMWMLGAMHALFEHTPLHEQMPMCNAIVLMEV